MAKRRSLRRNTRASAASKAVTAERASRLYRMLKLLASGPQTRAALTRRLGLDDAFFAPTVRDSDSILRLLHYPPLPFDAEGLRAGPHEDINAITLLLGAEEAGLGSEGRFQGPGPADGARGHATVGCRIEVRAYNASARYTTRNDVLGRPHSGTGSLR